MKEEREGKLNGDSERILAEVIHEIDMESSKTFLIKRQK